MILYKKGMPVWDYIKAAWKRYAIAAALLLGLLAFFMGIEAASLNDAIHYVNIPLDNYIPFIPQFVIPYILWFPYLFGSYIFIAATENLEYRRMATILFAGWALFMVFCMVYPNGLSIRPDLTNVEGGFSIFVMKIIHAVDTPTNVLPSMHVYATMCMHTALMRSDIIKRRRWHVWALRIFVALIAMSTVFIKQHSIVDVVTAFAYYGVMYLIVYVWRPGERRTKKEI